MSQGQFLSDIPVSPYSVAEPTHPQDARVNRPVRNQIEMVMRDLDSFVPDDHTARAVWQFIDRMEISAFYASIKSVLCSPGRPATDPQTLLALWVYATVEGVGSARRLEKLCEEHDVYRWLAGGVPINYHMLSDFRVANQAALDDLLTKILAAMMATGLVTLEEVAHDGTKIRTSAGDASFHRRRTLEEYLEAARERVEQLAKEREHPDPGVSARQRAARERAARERQQRVEEALRQLVEVEAAKERQKKKRTGKKITEARASTTDPEARVMRMPNGGFNPAYNVQLVTDVESLVVVGVAVSNRGADQGEALGMEQQVVKRTGKHPKHYLMDSGFINLEQIIELDRSGVEVYAPTNAGHETPKPKDPPEIASWRARMSTEEGKETYKKRASTAEWTNAQVKGRHRMQQFSVRGLTRVTSVMLLMAITHDLLRWITLSQ